MSVYRVAILLAALAGTARAEGPAFDAEPHPPPPDYALASSWAARGAGGAAKPADVFFIQPTTFQSERWNQDIADAATNAITDETVTRRQLSAFAACCRLYQPRYRQASIRAFAAMQGDGGKAYALAYEDVRRAFRLFLQETHGRPFILAGHSQGALHARRLLDEEIAGKPAAARLVAAYVPGLGIPIGALYDAGLTPCTRPRQTGCVLSWNSFLPSADVSAYVARSNAAYVAARGHGPGEALLCTNPLSFDARKPTVAWAACTGGVLRVTPAPGASLTPLPGGSLHLHDITLFWAELSANAATRVAAFARAPSRRCPPLHPGC
jgi:hypothetical protein